MPLVTSCGTKSVNGCSCVTPGSLTRFARKRTVFECLCSMPMHNASKRHSSLSWHRRQRAERASAESLIMRPKLGSFWHDVAALTSCLMCTGCSKNPMGMWSMLNGWKLGDWNSLEFPRASAACRIVAGGRSCADISKG